MRLARTSDSCTTRHDTRQVGVVFINSNYAQAYVRGLRAAAQRSSVSVHAVASYEDEYKNVPDHPTSARSALQLLKAAGLNVIVAIVYDATPILNAAVRKFPAASQQRLRVMGTAVMALSLCFTFKSLLRLRCALLCASCWCARRRHARLTN